MTFEMGLTLCILVLIFFVVGALFYRVCRRSDFITFRFRDRAFTFQIPNSGGESHFISAPYIRLVNQFILKFATSNESKIEFTAGDIRLNGRASSILQPLQGVDYERVRLRLRVMSNLNPVVNIETEEGRIHVVFGTREVKFRTLFGPKGESISLEKL